MTETAPRPFIEVMAKHLPPSASTLRLADVNAAAGAVLLELRPDMEPVSVYGADWMMDENSADAVTAYGTGLIAGLLRAALWALRPGGRLIVVDPHGAPDHRQVETLEAAGYTRILVEAALREPLQGVLMRGEKPHTTADTLARVSAVAQRDAAATDLAGF